MVQAENDVMPLEDAYLVSPELALVDPQLAAQARRELDAGPGINGHAFARQRPPGRMQQPTLTVVTSFAAAAPVSLRGDDRLAARLRRTWDRHEIRLGVLAAAATVLVAVGASRTLGGKEAAVEPVLPPPTTPSEVASPQKSDHGAQQYRPRPRTSVVPTTPSDVAPLQNSDRAQRYRPRPRAFAWAPAPRASAYRVELFKGNTRIFSEETKKTQVTIPGRWPYGNATRSLEPGAYRWVVWPIVSGARSSRAIVQSTVVIPGR
jgi:hypothetical protein